MMKYQISALLCLSCLSLLAWSSPLIYTPVNPAFGGNPLNGSVLLNNAQSQNNHKDPDSQNNETAIDEFNERLQRSLLNRLTNTIAGKFVDADGNLLEGETETTDYIIVIEDLQNGTLSVTTIDKLTGESTRFTITQ